MNKRLILFFELLKQMGVHLGEINMTLDRNRIEDWDESILYDVKGQKQKRKLPNFLVKVIEDLLDEYEYKFNRYNNYDIDEYWYLTILINTELKEINFQSSCKQEKENEFEREYILNDLKEDTRNIINVLTNNNKNIVDIEFYGRWDDGGITKVYVNNNKYEFDDDENYWTVVNELMILREGKYWNENVGSKGEVRLWGDDILMDGFDYTEEYEPTNLNLTIKPEDYK
jgi:hypothetical protein